MPNPDILIDADVVSHFITAGEADALCRIFPEHRIFMLDTVHRELQNWPQPEMKQVVSELLSRKRIRLMDFPEEDEEVKREYFYIKKKLFKGDGESACLAVARYRKNILASSNLKDTKYYCELHHIHYLTTMDFLCQAYQSGFFDESRCDAFITAVLRANSRLPVTRFADYVCRNIDFMNPDL